MNARLIDYIGGIPLTFFYFMTQFYNQIQPVWMPDCDNDDDRIKTSFVVVGPMNEDQSTISKTATAD